MNSRLRQSGRTTRLLESALKLALAGRAVYVIGNSDAHAICLRRQFLTCTGQDPGHHGIKFETPEELDNLDLLTGKLRRAHPNAIALIDHHVFESRFAGVFRQMHAFDLPPESPGPAAGYASLPVSDIIDRILGLLYDCPRNSDCRRQLEKIKDDIFLELPETRTALLCQVGHAINKHVPSGKGNDHRDGYWLEIRDVLKSAFPSGATPN